MMNLKEIIEINCNLTRAWHFLANCLFYDKVLHITVCLKPMCNTLLGATYAIKCQITATPYFPFHRTAMLDDRASLCPTAIFDTISSPFPGRAMSFGDLRLKRHHKI